MSMLIRNATILAMDSEHGTEPFTGEFCSCGTTGSPRWAPCRPTRPPSASSTGGIGW